MFFVSAVCVVLLTTFFVRSGVDAMGSGSVFTSSGNVHALFAQEKNLGIVLDEFVNEQQRQLNELKQLITTVKEVQVPPSDLEMDPGDGFAVLSRLNTLSEKVNEVLNGSSIQSLQNVLQHVTIPNQDDINGAAKAMLRLQRVYKSGPQQLMPNASATEVYGVGREAYLQGDFGSAIVWFKYALKKLNDEEEKKTELIVDVLDHLSFLQYKMNNLKIAIKYSERLLELDPAHQRVRQNLEFYRTTLERAKEVERWTPKDMINHEGENVLQHSEEDMELFRRLCRGEKLYTPTMPLMCRYMTYGHAHLTYQPIKVEYLHEGRQRLQVFRGFATPNECEHLKKEGGARLQRAVAWTDGAFRPVEFRISTAAWLYPDHDDVISSIHRRIEDATQVDIKNAEALQISNYGMGGFYEPHFDHAKRGTNKNGERLSTFMIYLNNVKEGGYTVFPRLGAAVQPGHGDAVFWYNLFPNGDGDAQTLHAACPVLKGAKWVANKWIHEQGNVCRAPFPHEQVNEQGGEPQENK
eukprot:m.95297 g.95297  ORF g.95297 m.95297 type:complete len:523 (+) comp12433_c0_seq3:152-1720(+)